MLVIQGPWKIITQIYHGMRTNKLKVGCFVLRFIVYFTRLITIFLYIYIQGQLKIDLFKQQTYFLKINCIVNTFL